MKLSTFDLPRGSTQYVTLPSGRSINVHVANRDTYGTDIHVQSNSEQWPEEYSDSLVHFKGYTGVFSDHIQNLSHLEIEFLQDKFTGEG